MTQPDAVSSYLYAATALKLARALEPYLPEEAADWEASAMRAMDFADEEWAKIPVEHKKMHELEDIRHLAALEAWLSTGDEVWHERVKASAVYQDPDTPLRQWFHDRDGGERDQLDAAFLYATQTLREPDPVLRESAKQSILNLAEYATEFTHENVYGFAKYDPTHNMGWGTLGAPQAKHLVKAWWLTGDQRYYDAAVLANNLPLGMNADQLSFTTGLGSKWPDHPLVIDFLRTGKMPPGITLYGTWNPKFWDSWGIQRAAKAGLFYPEYKDWPTSEGYVDIGYGNAGQAEFTVQHTMSYANTVWGFLSLKRPQAISADLVPSEADAPEADAVADEVTF
jgi:endoglucanase